MKTEENNKSLLEKKINIYGAITTTKELITPYINKDDVNYIVDSIKEIKIFNLGEVVSKFSHQNNFTNKEKNISFFKMGFCSDIYISKKYEKKYD